MNSIPGSGVTFDQQELDDYYDLTQFLINIYSLGRSESKLDSLEVDSLLAVANTKTRLASSKAKSILSFFYGYDFGEGVESRRSTIISFPKPKKTSFEPGVIENEVVIFPNPNSGAFNILVLDDEVTNFSYFIRNIEGKHLLSGNAYSNQTSISLENYESGIYILQIYYGESVVTKKLIIE